MTCYIVLHIDPALTALAWLAGAPWTDHLVELLSNASPLLRLIQISGGHALRGNFLGNLLQDFSFPGCPGGFLALYVLDEEPALLTLE